MSEVWHVHPKSYAAVSGPTASSLLGHTLAPGLKHAKNGWRSPVPPHDIVPDDDVGPGPVVPFDDDCPPVPPAPVPPAPS